jgi:hypothetical protein
MLIEVLGLMITADPGSSGVEQIPESRRTDVLIVLEIECLAEESKPMTLPWLIVLLLRFLICSLRISSDAESVLLVRTTLDCWKKPAQSATIHGARTRNWKP